MDDLPAFPAFDGPPVFDAPVIVDEASSPDNLRRVARQHRLRMFVLLAGIGYGIVHPFLAFPSWAGTICHLAHSVCCVWAVWPLLQQFVRRAARVGWLLALFAPLLSLCMRFALNQRVIRIFWKNHVPVRFLGADLARR